MGFIDIVSVGWAEDDLTLGAIRYLLSGGRVVLKTARCGAASYLTAQGAAFETCDGFYDRSDDFDALNAAIADQLLSWAERGDVVFAVNDPGDTAAQVLYSKAPDRVRLHGGPAEGSALMSAVGGTARHVCAGDIGNVALSSTEALVVTEIDTALIAGEVKLSLMRYWPDEWPVTFSLPDGTLRVEPLYRFDRLPGYDHRTAAALRPIDDLRAVERFTAADLMRLMRVLRGFDGCPWDREQTHESLRPYVIEEAYEVAEAIDRGDCDALCDELGDVLYQIIFHACIGEEYSEFDLSDVMTALGRKIIRRHPHVFGDEHCDTADEVTRLWNEVKAREKAIASPHGKLDGIARSLPALTRAAKVVRAMRDYGLPTDENPGDPGDELLTLAARLTRDGVDAEAALHGALEKRIARAKRLQSLLEAAGKDLKTLDHDELLRFWKEAEEI